VTTALKRLASAVQLRPWPPYFQRLSSSSHLGLAPIGSKIILNYFFIAHAYPHLGNLLLVTNSAGYWYLIMSSSPQSRPLWRYPRAHLDGNNPIVLRFPNGQTTGAKLQVISLTGGLLSLSQPVDQGSQVKLIFLTGAGAVLGGAEMLPPVTDDLQPFRFVSLAADDQRRLGALIGQRPSQNESELAWMEKLRAASAQQNKPAFWRFKLAGVIGLLTIGLAIAAYLLHFGLLR
jgi:hypothetical protein